MGTPASGSRLDDMPEPASNLAWRDRLNDSEKQLYMRLKYREAVATSPTAYTLASVESALDGLTPPVNFIPPVASPRSPGMRVSSGASGYPNVVELPLSPMSGFRPASAAGSVSSFKTARSHFDPLSATRSGATSRMVSPAASSTYYSPLPLDLGRNGE